MIELNTNSRLLLFLGLGFLRVPVTSFNPNFCGVFRLCVVLGFLFFFALLFGFLLFICGRILKVFLFDVCDLETPGTTTDAPLPGTFTLKLNNGLTFNKGAFRYTSKEAAVEALTKKLGF